MRASSRSSGLLLLALIAVSVPQAAAGELKLFSAAELRQPVTELARAFVKGTTHRIELVFGPSAALAKRIASGEAGDVVVVTASGAHALEKLGRAIEGTVVDVARLGVVLVVRAGAARPDVSTPDALREALLAAARIAHADPAIGGNGGVEAQRAFAALALDAGFVDRLLVAPTAVEALKRLAGGEVDLAVAPGDVIASVPGVARLAPLPGAGAGLTFAATVVRATRAEPLARELLAHFAGPAGRAAFQAAGFEVPQ